MAILPKLELLGIDGGVLSAYAEFTMAEIDKSVGTYMSVDAAAALERNHLLIDRIRATVRRAVEPVVGNDPAAPGATWEHINRVLDKLPARDVEILRAIFLEERDKDEICDRFGIDRDYMRVLMHRAKEHLNALTKQASEPSPAKNTHDSE